MDKTPTQGAPAGGRSSGCMKWTCCCLGGLVLLMGMILVVAWIHFNRWEPDTSGWRRLPPGTIMALEVHDVKGILDHGFADPGLEGLIQRLLLPLLESTDVEITESFRELVDAYRIAGFLYRAAAPNSIVIGESRTFPGDKFIILQMPVWLRNVMSLSQPDSIPHTFESDEPNLHFAHRDGLLVAAPTPEQVQDILTTWDLNASPLGAGALGGGPRIYAGMQTPEPPRLADTVSPREGHFAFADPFALVEPEAVPVEEDGVAVRITVVPEKSGWNVTGEFGLGPWLKGSTDRLSELVRNIASDIPHFRGERIGVFSRTATTPEIMDDLRRASARYSRDAGLTPGRFRKDLALRWLHDAWLANAGTEWTIAVQPAAKHDTVLPYPPIPVVTLGWTIRENTTPAEAGRDFDTALVAWLEALQGENPLDGRIDLSEVFNYGLFMDETGLGGRLELPPILVNGAAPMWRFDTQGGRALFTSDPSGGWDASVVLDSPSAPAPSGMEAVTQGEWNVDETFLRDVFEFLLDRYSMLPAAFRKDSDDTLSVAQRTYMARQILRSYPRGTFIVHGDIGGSRLRFASRIGFGEK